MYNFEQELKKNGLTTDTFEACLKDIRDKVVNKIDLDWGEIVKKYNLPIASDTLRKASSSVPFGQVFVTEYFTSKDDTKTQTADDLIKCYGAGSSINKDGTYSSDRLIELKKEDLTDKNTLLLAHGYNPRVWELVSAKNSIWNTYSRANGVIELYASKITVKEKAFDVTKDDLEEWLANLGDKHHSPIFTVSEESNGDKILLIDIADLHLNLIATQFINGEEYNCDIAEKLLYQVVSNVLTRTSQYSFNKILFCIGGDMLNADTLSGTTTKGTPQSNEKHLYEAYNRLCDATVTVIEYLLGYAPVQIVYVPGNHDSTMGYNLACYIKAWFRKDERVSVDCSPMPRKYIKFGKTLFVFAHDGNAKTLPAVIADEAREYWSDVETTEVFLQHMHTEQVLLEDHNMRIQRLPTISARSEWAVSKGFGSKRQAKSFIFDEEDGLIDVVYTPIKKQN